MTATETYAAEDQRAMMSTITGFWVSQLTATLAHLEIAEHLHDGPKTAARIAELAGSDPRATFRLLRAAVDPGLVSHDPETDCFASTSLLDRLRASAPDSLRNVALVWNAPLHWQAWGRFTECVRTGENQVSSAVGRSTFDYLAEHPVEADQFSRAMAELSTPTIREAVVAIEAGPGTTIVDVGGATGAFVLGMLAEHPGTDGLILDLPHVTAAAEREIAARGMQERCRAVPGDFFEAVPEADLFLVKFVLHDWGDDACIRVLQQCRRAMRPGARVVVVDMVTGTPDDPGTAALMDLNMLAIAPGAREHDLADFDRFFAAAGFVRTDTTELSPPYCVLEAEAV
ncbi:acetylserotonin O-methyltransferase [Brachybacterium sp. ACRRE]|uniref:acetylserotonin O-methyltransferase n=1 Tax=Brachybacterium sp. ACRRE TaxID=2918184 RepID=UPI001EF2948D|nr:acetylserotonin O-methyltransferase [Brachybacterium sp. ACRRE]MCG7310788.1 acetylserotonin O-methyltransferase [Brachybacterium sp. ACRRE]